MSRTGATATQAAGPRSSGLAGLSINIKILSTVALAALVAMVVGILGLQGQHAASKSAQEIYSHNVISIQALGDLRATVLQARLTVVNHAVSQDQQTMSRYEQVLTGDMQAIEQAFTAYRNSRPSTDPAVVDELFADYQAYSQLARDKLLPASRRNDIAAWQHIRDTELTPLMTEAMQDITAMNAVEADKAAQNAAAAKSSYESHRNVSIILLAVGLLLAVGAGIYVSRGIVASLKKVEAVCESLAEGDLTHTAGLHSRDEPGRMGRALDTAVSHLRNTVTTIGASAAALAGAAQQLTTVSSQLQSGAADAANRANAASHGSEQVNTGVRSIAAGAEEMSASITEIASNAGRAAQLNRPTCWHSTPPLSRRAPVNSAKVSPSSPARSRNWPNRPPGPPRRSLRGSRRSRPPAAVPPTRSMRSPQSSSRSVTTPPRSLPPSRNRRPPPPR